MANYDDISFTKTTYSEGAAPGTPATAGDWVQYFKTDGMYYKDDAGTETGPLGAASLPYWIERQVTNPNSPYTDDDEFDDDSLAGTAVTITGTATWAESNGVMSVALSGMTQFDVNARAFTMTPVSAPVTMETYVRIAPASNDGTDGSFYIGFADGTAASSNVAAYYLRPDLINYWVAGTYTAPTFNTIKTAPSHYVPGLFVRVIWTGSNTFEVNQSIDGVNWVDMGARGSIARTMTPTHYILGGFNDASNVATVSFEYLRVVTSDLGV